MILCSIQKKSSSSFFSLGYVLSNSTFSKFGHFQPHVLIKKVLIKKGVAKWCIYRHESLLKGFPPPPASPPPLPNSYFYQCHTQTNKLLHKRMLTFRAGTLFSYLADSTYFSEGWILQGCNQHLPCHTSYIFLLVSADVPSDAAQCSGKRRDEKETLMFSQ